MSMTVDKTTKKLANAALMVDEEKKWGIYLLDRLATFAYMTSPGLLPLAILKGLDWTLKYGRTDAAAPTLAVAALILAGSMGNFAGGRKYADLAMQFMSPSVESRTLFLCNYFVLPYQIPVGACIKSYTQSYESGVRSGDLESAFYNAQGALETKLNAGYSLPKLLQEYELYSRRAARLPVSMMNWWPRPQWQLAANLANKESNGQIMTNIFDATEFKQVFEDFPQFQKQVHRVNATGAFWSGNHEQVVQIMVENKYHKFSAEKSALGANYIGGLYFHCAMACLSLVHKDKKKHSKEKGHANKFLKKFKGWVSKGNPNVQHYESLLEAELASINGKPFIVAAKHYECAILLAGRLGFTNDYALAHERFGDHCYRSGDAEGGKAHYEIAGMSYEKWGAMAVLDLLQKRCEL